MSLFEAGLIPALDTDGAPINGATWEFYASGTLTPLSVYSDATETTALGSTITANSAGRFPVAYLKDTLAYRAILKGSNGLAIRDIDPVNNEAPIGDLASADGTKLIGTPETTLYDLLYRHSAQAPIRGGFKTFARTWQECLDQSADLTEMRGYAAYASTTGGAGKTVYKVWNDSDDAATIGSFRWAVAQAKANGGGRIIGVPVGQHTINLRSRILIDFDNVTIDFPGRNWRFGALNDVEMLRVAAKNVIVRRMSTFRYPHFTGVDNQFITYNSDNGNLVAGQSSFAISFAFFDSSGVTIRKNRFLTLTENLDYVIFGGGGPSGSTGTLVLTDAIYTASMAGTTTMTVSAVTSGTLAVGQTVYDAAGAVIGTIQSLGTGTGGTGTYILSASATKSSQQMTSSAGVTATDDIRIYGKFYQQDGISVRPELCDQVWIDQCTFTDHTDGACDITSALVDLNVAATNLVPGVRYEITTAGTTTWTSIGAANNNVGTTFICTAAGTGTGVAKTATSRITVSRCHFRRQLECMAIGSSATSAQSPPPAWAPTALSQTPIVNVTLDRNVFEGCSQRAPRVGALAFVHSINNVHLMSAYRRDDGTTAAQYAAWATTGGKLLSEGDYLRSAGTDVPANGMYATTTAWDAASRLGPGAFAYNGTVAESGITLTPDNTSSVPTPPYTLAYSPVPSTSRLEYVWTQIAGAGAEVSPLSEMHYTFVSKADGDAQGLWPDGIDVITVDGGYRVRTLPDIPSTGENPVTNITAGSVSFPRGSTLILVSDAITLRDGQAFNAVDTEGAAASDVLSTINAPTGVVLPDGYLYGIRIASNSRIITVTSAGNIDVPSGPIRLDSTTKMLWFRWGSSTSRWGIVSQNGRTSGEYTATLTSVANVASSSFTRAFFELTNGYVTVFYNVTVTPTAGASTQTDLGISLPIPSNLASGNDLIGSGANAVTGSSFPAVVFGDAANDRATLRFLSPGTSAYGVSGSFSYKVL